MKQCLGYLSGAPRVSTRVDAEATGARAHVSGVIGAFKGLGWEVQTFIVGDRVPRKWTAKGTQKALSTSFYRRLVADMLRLVMNTVNAQRVWLELGGNVDWVYERFAAFQMLGWPFKQHGVPWILETNGPLFYEAKSERKSIVLSQIARRLEVKAYRECDVLICITESLKEIIVQVASIPPEKVVVIPNGVDTTFCDPEHYEPKRLFDSFTIGFVGNLYAWAGLDLLLEALNELRAAGIDLSLVVVGDGLMRESLEAQAQQLGLSSSVAFVGRVPWSEVPHYIAGFDVAFSGQVQLQVGKMYHSPLKLYEYTAMAKPVVASAFEDARRIIQDGETGFLFQAGDKADLKGAITRAYHSWSVLPTMGRKAREEIVANHSWTARIDTLITEVERILG